MWTSPSPARAEDQRDILEPLHNQLSMDCGRDLRLIWYGVAAKFSGYGYHTPDRVIGTVETHIAHHKGAAESLQKWLDAYKAQTPNE